MRLRRDDIVSGSIAVVALAVLGARLARPGGAGAHALLWCTWAAAAAFLLLLVPSIQDRLRAGSPAAVVRFGAPASLAVLGLALGAAAQVEVWRTVLWPALVLLSAALVGSDRETEPGPWRLLAAALALALVAGLWDRSLKIQVLGGMRLGFSFLAAVALALFLLRSVRPLHTLDVSPGLSLRDLLTAGLGVAGVAAVAAPVGVLAGYVVWNPRPGTLLASVERLAGLVIFVGIPEELLFRGLVQEGLTRLRGPRFALVAASLLFGGVHIFKSTGLLPEQVNALGLNWRYAALASLAGLGYGWVYRRTGRVSAAALTHGTVDWLWSSFFLR